MKTSVACAAVCAGAPIVALWIGAQTAWAQPATSTDASPPGATSTSNEGPGSDDEGPGTGGGEQGLFTGAALSAGGLTLIQFGDAEARSSGPSIAFALNGGRAEADGIGNFVFAGDDSTASARGNFNDVRANFGSHAEATGNFDRVYAIPDSTAEVSGDFNNAFSLCGGEVSISAQSAQIRSSAPCLGG